MIRRRSRLLRWTEDAEAEQMRALAIFQRDPQEVAACRLAVAAPAASLRSAPTVLARLLSVLGGRGVQIARDDGR
jgi:hypothetical protein